MTTDSRPPLLFLRAIYGRNCPGFFARFDPSDEPLSSQELDEMRRYGAWLVSPLEYLERVTESSPRSDIARRCQMQALKLQAFATRVGRSATTAHDPATEVVLRWVKKLDAHLLNFFNRAEPALTDYEWLEWGTLALADLTDLFDISEGRRPWCLRIDEGYIEGPRHFVPPMPQPPVGL